VNENWTRELIVVGLAAGTAAVVTVPSDLRRGSRGGDVGLAVAGVSAMGAAVVAVVAGGERGARIERAGSRRGRREASRSRWARCR